jgi:hypothetical protein
MQRLLVSHECPLSRLYRFPQRITVGSHKIASIEEGFWSACLTHHGLPDAASQLHANQKIKDDPSTISVWAKSQMESRNLTFKTEWIFERRHVYYAIMIALVAHGNNPFMTELKNIRMKFGTRVVFVAVSGRSIDDLWGCGLRWKAADEFSGVNFPGMNLYGKQLSRLVRELEASALTNPYDLEALLSAPSIPRSPREGTVLLLSDSTARQMLSIPGGTVLAQSGAKS